MSSRPTQVRRRSDAKMVAAYKIERQVKDRIKAQTKATIRCIPLDDDTTLASAPSSGSPGKCILTGATSPRRVLFARAY